MPVETAQYINTLQPDWPLGTDPESAGDDHLRMVKQVLQNTFPNMNATCEMAAATGTRLEHGFMYTAATGNAPELWKARSVAKDDGSLMAIMALAPSIANFQANDTLVMNYHTLTNLIYPVGSVVMYADNVNPNTRLGFGTWVAVAGMIAGAGTVADSQGMSVALGAGDHHANGYWRVQDGHIVAETKNLDSGKTNSAGKHTHASQYNWAGSKVSETSGGDVGNDGGTPCVVNTAASFKTTEAADHSHTVTGTVTIGEGSKTSGSAFINPYYGVYVWRRSA